MTVIDLRDELYNRKIEIIEITKDFIFYAEELKINGVDSVYLYSYSFSENAELLLSCFSFEDAAYIQHYYSCENSIIILFENGSGKVWVIKVDKATGEEVYRKSISLVGRFSECVALDDSNIIVYTKSDDEYKSLFNRCLEQTNSDCLANLYDLDKNIRYFIKDFNTALLVKNSMVKFFGGGTEYMLLNDPFSGEKEKEAFVKELGSETQDIRDNIWLMRKNKFLEEIKAGEKNIKLKRVATAGSNGTVRFECICSGDIVFKGCSYKHKREHFCAVPLNGGKIRTLTRVKKYDEHSRYYTDKDKGKIYFLTHNNDEWCLNGEVGTDINITYPDSVGNIISCIEDRYIIADSILNTNEKYAAIFDSALGLKDVFQARCEVKGEVVVLY